MNQYRILLLNCTTKSEPSEAEFLCQFFRMMRLRFPKRVRFKSKQIQRKTDLIKYLRWEWPNIVHISAHGHSKKYPSGIRGKETTIQVGRASVSAEEVADLPKTSTELVFLNACLSSYKDMAKAFLERGVKWYLAPKTKIYWVNAALFAVMFYKRYVWDRTSFKAARKFARGHTKLRRDFPDYWCNLP